MTNRPLPKGFTLHPEYGLEVLTDDYNHWRVGDLLEILEHYDENARVWISPENWDPVGGPVPVRPVEGIMRTGGDVFL